MASSHSTPVPSSNQPLAHLLHDAFNLPARNPWVANFLFTPDNIPAKDLVTGIEKASAPIVDYHFGGDLPTSEKFVLLPLFSNSTLTLGLHLHAGSASRSNRTSITRSKFVFDNLDTTLLAVSNFSTSEPVTVTFMSNSLTFGRTLAFLQFDGSVSGKLARGDKPSSSFHINSITSATVFWEGGTKCSSCSASWSQNCGCALKTKVPKHPMHFETLAPNVVLYGGTFSGKKITWKRSRKGQLKQVVNVRTTCNLEVSVSEKQVSELCHLERNSGKDKNNGKR